MTRPLAVLMAIALWSTAACGQAGDEATSAPADEATTAPPATEPPATAPPETQPPTTAPEPETTIAATTTIAANESAALGFFRSTEHECNEYSLGTGNDPPAPQRFGDATVDGSSSPGVWRIVDGQGDVLLADLNDSVLYGVDGRDGVLPHAYSFGCPPGLYVGTLDH